MALRKGCMYLFMNVCMYVHSRVVEKKKKCERNRRRYTVCENLQYSSYSTVCTVHTVQYDDRKEPSPRLASPRLASPRLASGLFFLAELVGARSAPGLYIRKGSAEASERASERVHSTVRGKKRKREICRRCMDACMHACMQQCGSGPGLLVLSCPVCPPACGGAFDHGGEARPCDWWCGRRWMDGWMQ